MIAKKNIKSLSPTPKYIILFNNPENPDTPYYCIEGTEQWTEAPKRGFLYYDPLEDTPQYQKISRTVDLLIALNRKARKSKGRFGSCHYIWNLRKKILRECYDIEWHTPDELNPSCNFD